MSRSLWLSRAGLALLTSTAAVGVLAGPAQLRGGGAGNDLLSGDDGDDTLSGEAGDDWLDTGGGLNTETDHLDGGDNATGKGDNCYASEADTTANCEYAEQYWPGSVPGGIR
jgi:Ca2+-binding RTX toxin-like protein